MIISLFARTNYLRFAFGILLVFFTGCKIITPTYVMVKAAYKEVIGLFDTDEEQAEKAFDNGSLSKTTSEYFSDLSTDPIYHLPYISLIHYTDYTNHYLSSCFLQEIAPPPDSSL